MKSSLFGLSLATAGLLLVCSAEAQYKSPRNYFPKNSPAPPAGGSQPATGGQKATPNTPAKQDSAKNKPTKFKDLLVNGQFYFLSDTNRTVAWTKISATTAKNPNNGITRNLSGETAIQN